MPITIVITQNTPNNTTSWEKGNQDKIWKGVVNFDYLDDMIICQTEWLKSDRKLFGKSKVVSKGRLSYIHSVTSYCCQQHNMWPVKVIKQEKNIKMERAIYTSGMS